MTGEQQEKVLKGLPNLVHMESESRDNMGWISLTFDIDVTMSDALLRVSNKLDEVPFYPENVDIHVVLGRIYLGLGNMRKAEESYLSAVSINPFDPEVHTALAAIFEREGRTKEAERERKVLDILAEKDGQNE